MNKLNVANYQLFLLLSFLIYKLCIVRRSYWCRGAFGSCNLSVPGHDNTDSCCNRSNTTIQSNYPWQCTNSFSSCWSYRIMWNVFWYELANLFTFELCNIFLDICTKYCQISLNLYGLYYMFPNL